MPTSPAGTGAVPSGRLLARVAAPENLKPNRSRRSMQLPTWAPALTVLFLLRATMAMGAAELPRYTVRFGHPTLVGQSSHSDSCTTSGKVPSDGSHWGTVPCHYWFPISFLQLGTGPSAAFLLGVSQPRVAGLLSEDHVHVLSNAVPGPCLLLACGTRVLLSGRRCATLQWWLPLLVMSQVMSTSVVAAARAQWRLSL